MAENCYGGKKVSYVVTHRNADDRIEIFVFHDNVNLRNIIENNIDNPAFFLDRYDVNDSTMAKKWLARVVRDYRSKFEQGLVIFTIIHFK